jgi:hypothetical protein
VQVAQLERRFAVFAAWQAAEAQEGWRIEAAWVEAPLAGVLDVDGAPFGIHGRIDRVDAHPIHGFRILDYKTGDRPESPAASHAGPKDAGGRTREGRGWRSLQLPLYAFLARGAGLGSATPFADRAPELAFYSLSKKLSAAPLLVAPWDDGDLAGAVACAGDIVRRLRRHEYWPPGPPPRWDDGLAAIAGDHYPARYRPAHQHWSTR